MLFIAVAVATGIAVVIATVRQEASHSRRQQKLWTQAARVLSGTQVRLRSGETGFDLLTKDGVRLAAWSETRGMSHYRERWVSFIAEDRVLLDLVIAYEGISSRLGKLIGGDDIETGDAEFDRVVLLRGAELRVVAICDRRVRAMIRELVSQRGTVAQGQVRLELQGGTETFGEIVGPARAVAGLARALSERAEQPAALLLRQNAVGDPVAGVRRRALELLLRSFPGHAETRAALEALTTDPDPEVRLLATLNHDDGSAGDRLSEMALDASLTNAARADALSRLVMGKPGVGVLPVVERALADRSPRVRAVAVDAVGRAHHHPAIATLLSLATKAADPDEQRALCDAFWRLRDPAAERVLLDLFERGGLSVRLAAARALGRVGGVSAVEPLRNAAAGLLAGELGRIAAEAVAAIQARLTHAAEGQLSVLDGPDEAGRVSVATAAGAVSVAMGGGSRKPD